MILSRSTAKMPTLDADLYTPLLWVIRAPSTHLQLTGHQVRLRHRGVRQLYACIWMVGPIRSCTTAVSMASGKQVTPSRAGRIRAGKSGANGLAGKWTLPQLAGYCQSGQIMACPPR